MASRGKKKPANSVPPRKGRLPHGSVNGSSSECQEHVGYIFSPSVIIRDSQQKLVTPAKPQKSVNSMVSGGGKTPLNSALPWMGPSPQRSVYGGYSKPDNSGACTFSPSVSSKDSLQKLVIPVQPQKHVESRNSQCSAGSVGSNSAAGPLDICMIGNTCAVKLKPSILETNREKKREIERSKDVPPLHLRPGMVLLKRFIEPNDQVYGGYSKPDNSGACTFSPSVSSKDSLQKLVTPVQPQKPVESRNSQCSAGSVGSNSAAGPLDICMSGNTWAKLKPSILETNREKKREMERSKDVPPLHLRPGMVLLKRFIKPNDQVKIVNLCRQLGLGPGGFYKPGYRDGAMLRLWMMCLGKNWDPNSCLYGDRRPFDGAQPPTIPEELKKFVQDSIQASHEFLKQRIGAANAVQELPAMTPDICLVNFYNSCGRLGLHQDKDESRSSLDNGLPVVSFSIGETTEFLYGDVTDEEKLSKVDLESGDVLIFGGKSRHIFHGVSSTKPKTSPMWLTDETSLRPGRLNLTFRQYY